MMRASDVPAGGRVGVVHLVRAQNGIAPFRRFLQSYAQNPGDADHDLILVFKGFQGERKLSEYRGLLEGISCQWMMVRDYGFDIRPYIAATRRFSCDYFCFLNSFSVLLDRAWLRKLLDCLARPGVGLVGATGSYESLYSNAREQRGASDGAIHRLRHQFLLMRLARRFDPFPNWHIRTNGFLIPRIVLERVERTSTLTKMNAMAFESGKRGLTKQVLRMKLRPLVVGKDGRGYEPEEWPDSKTFRQDAQENLLIADNQTEWYDTSDHETRVALSRLAWGAQSRVKEMHST